VDLLCVQLPEVEIVVCVPDAPAPSRGGVVCSVILLAKGEHSKQEL
jgi:hypothetical protein